MGFSQSGIDEATADGGRGSHIPMDVKFEEEPYEDEDWFLMLLSELIFDKLKLEKPKIEHGQARQVLEESELFKTAAMESEITSISSPEEPDLKSLLVREGPIDKRFPLID